MKTETSSRSPYLIAGCILLAIFAVFFPLFAVLPRSSARAAEALSWTGGDFAVIFDTRNVSAWIDGKSHYPPNSNRSNYTYPAFLDQYTHFFSARSGDGVNEIFLCYGSSPSSVSVTPYYSYRDTLGIAPVYSDPVSDIPLASNNLYFNTSFYATSIPSATSVSSETVFSSVNLFPSDFNIELYSGDTIYFNFGIQMFPDRSSVGYNSSVAVPSQVVGVSVPIVRGVTNNFAISYSNFYSYFVEGVKTLLSLVSTFDTLGNTSSVQHFGALSSTALPVIYCRLVQGTDCWTTYRLFGDGAGVPEDFVGNPDYLFGSFASLPLDGSNYLAVQCVNATPIGGISPPPSDDPGYDKGYSEGYQAGYNAGYADGQNSAVSADFANPFTLVFDPVREFLSINLFGSVSIGDFLSVGLFVAIALIFIKMFAGG